MKEIDSFDIFWRLYPRKIGKGHARKAWEKACKKLDPTLVCRALARQIELASFSPDSSFIPHPTTWLNGERWDDEIVIRRPELDTRNGAIIALARMDAEGPLIEGHADESD